MRHLTVILAGSLCGLLILEYIMLFGCLLVVLLLYLLEGCGHGLTLPVADIPYTHS
jgi:hypothetical protein